MRHYACLFVAIVATSLVVSAQDVLPTAPQPVAIIPQGQMVHVLTRGVDVNFSGTRDDGDAVAAWHRFNASGLDIGSFEFPWSNVVASRPAIDTVQERMYVIVGDSIYALSTAFMVPMPLPGWSGGGASISVLNDTTLMVSVRPSYTDPGIVRFVDARTGAPYEGVIDAGMNVQMTYAINDDSVLVLSEGNFGALDGSLALATRSGSTWRSVALATGGTANHMCVHDGKAFVTMNGSHEIVIVDLGTRSVVRRIPTETAGYDGPRESTVHDGRLFVSTFSGDIRIYDIASGARVGRITVDAKPEALAIVNGTLWVCRTFDRASYAVANGVNRYALDNATGIVETMQRSGATRAIIATAGIVRLPDLDAIHGITVTGIDGRTSPAIVIDATTSAIDMSALPHGVYVARDARSTVLIVR